LRLTDSLAPFRHPAFAVAAFAILLAILAQAMTGSYMALLAVERAHMSPLELSAFLTLSAISGIGVTTLFGHWHDRRPRRWPLLLCFVAGIAGYGLAAVVTTPWMLMLIAFVLFGLANAPYALLFAIAKDDLAGAGARTQSQGMAALRMISSLSWAIGPAIGAGLVGIWSYAGVFFGAAAFSLAALVAVLAGRLQAAAPETHDQDAVPATNWLSLWPAVVALTLFSTAMFMGSNALSIATTSILHGTETDVGLLFSLCAALEVVVMGAYVIWPAKRASRVVLILGFLIFAAYFLAPILVPTLATLYWGQVPRAIAIGIFSVIGMLYVQNAMPNRTGTATALYSNTVNAGFLLSGIGTGLWAQAFGYWSIFGLCVALSLAGAALFALPLSRSR
jgi:SET family sugar efflux transporter-like MFS transporter